VNENDEDILPPDPSTSTIIPITEEEPADEGLIAENAYRCPTNCPPSSRLTS
jgi:hypothetical protein